MINQKETVVAAYDPTVLHRQLMAEVVPECSYAGGDPKAWQEKLRPRLSSLLCLDRMPLARCPLTTVSLWKREVAGGKIEKIRFASEPGHDVPAYLCLPRDVKPPYPFFICLQGHSTGMHNSIAVAFDDETKPWKVEGDRDFGLVCMRYGIAALCIEQRGFGECRDQSNKEGSFQGGCHNPALLAQMLGRTVLGERVYDVDRAIDYLMTRSDVDPSRIGVMGNSGGGTVSMFAGGLLDRLTHVMPSCSFSSFKASIMSINHCVCNYVPGLLTVAESADVVALAAPKPLVIVNGQDDPIFPIREASESFEQVKTIYRALGYPDNCRHVIGNGGHRFYADDAWPVMLELLRG